MIALSQNAGAWPFLLLSILILIVMGSILEGAAALIIFGPLLIPVAAQIGVNGLHFGVVLVIAMGIGLFAPPLGLGLYGACLIGGVPIESDGEADAGLSRLAVRVPPGDRVRPRSDALAAASARLPVGRWLRGSGRWLTGGRTARRETDVVHGLTARRRRISSVGAPAIASSPARRTRQTNS